MKHQTPPNGPTDATERRQIAPVICYPTDGLPHPDMEILNAARHQPCQNRRSDRATTRCPLF